MNINLILLFIFMKRKKQFKMKKIILLFSIILLSYSSCVDEKVLIPVEQINIQSSRDYLLAENLFNHIYRSIEEGFIYNGQAKECPSYTLLNNNSNNSDTLILDFGEENCLQFGQLKRGKIISTFNNKYHQEGAIINSTFSQFYINNILIEGNLELSCLANNLYKLEISNVNLTTSNGVININSFLEKEMISGQNSIYNYLDDRYLITGNISGNSSNGNNFNVLITEPITYELSCFQNSSCIAKSGKAIITPNNYEERLINYGDSLCDCNINVEINNEKTLIVLD